MVAAKDEHFVGQPGRKLPLSIIWMTGYGKTTSRWLNGFKRNNDVRTVLAGHYDQMMVNADQPVAACVVAA